MSMELLVGIGIVLFVLTYLFIKLGEKDNPHIYLQLLLLGFMVGLFIIVGKAGIDANCEMKLNNTEEIYKYGDNFTGYHWDYDYDSPKPNTAPFLFHKYIDYNYIEVCEDDNTEVIFYKFLVWISRIIVAYIIIYYLYEVLKYFSIIGGGKA